MGQCNIDHSLEDVIHKFESQREFLPVELHELFNHYFNASQSQESLNEIFHLLKKYDLASEEEQKSRNERLLIKLT